MATLQLITRSKEKGVECITPPGKNDQQQPSTLLGTDISKVVRWGANVFLLDSKKISLLGGKKTVWNIPEGSLLDLIASPEMLAVAVKLDLSTVQYRFYSFEGKRIELANPLTVPINLHKEAFGCFWNEQHFICRAGKTGLIKVDLKKSASEAFLGGEEIAEFRVIPERSQLVIFKKGKGGKPAKCQLVRLQDGKVITERQFFKADSVTIHPHPQDSVDAFLIICQTESDASGKSYYGESQLYLYTQGRFQLVQLDKAGPVHDVTWSPVAPEFVVAFGFMPARVALFSLEARPIYTFSPECAVNTLKFNAFGSLLLMGGFGNLPGKLEIWSRPKCRRLLTLEAPGASKLEIMGKWLIAATLTPRLRVDNGIKIFDLVLGTCTKFGYQELYAVECIQPNCDDDDDDPEKLMQPQKKSDPSSTSEPTVVKGKYVPPSLRGSLSPPSTQGVASLKQALDANLPHIDNRPKPSKEETRLKRLQEKMDQIAELRDRLNCGESLELNQMEKIKSEVALRQEIQELKSKLNH